MDRRGDLHGRSGARGLGLCADSHLLSGLPDDSPVPDYSGIRAEVTGPGEAAADFLVEGPAAHGLPRRVYLFRIESPGLTSSLSIAAEVIAMLESR